MDVPLMGSCWRGFHSLHLQSSFPGASRSAVPAAVLGRAGRVCTGDVSEGLSVSPPGRLLGNTALAGEGLQKPDPGWTGGLRAQPERGSGTSPALRAGREPVPPKASLSLCVSPEGAQCLCEDLQWPGTGAVPEQQLLGLMGDS